MFATDRRRRILEHVSAHGSASIHELAQFVEASEVTVRRDLRVLESQGLLDRRRGGAAVAGAQQPGNGAAALGTTSALEKQAIAALASTLVLEGDAVALGAGTTTAQLADRLVGVKDLTVVTNSLLVGESLGRSAEAVVVMTGGSLRGSTYGLVGSGAEQSFADLRVRRAFLSGDGLTSTWGLSTANLSEAGVDRAISDAAAEVLVLADHTKLGVDAMFQTVPPARIAHLITDDLADPEILAAFRRSGVQVHVASVHREQAITGRTGGSP
ncbi:MAG: DeoR/GlpR family DNA-binding transcription regulator [Rhodoglobus sp.]